MILKAIPEPREMIWGNIILNNLFGFNSQNPIGEVWLLSDHPLISTKLQTPSGESFDLRSLLKLFGLKLPRFPILIKLIASEQWLSVQVHPDDQLAQRIENEPWGKNECWFFLKDSTIALPSLNLDLKESLLNDSLTRDMNILHPRAGDLVYVPAGVLHAIGPGSLLIEVQQSSDLTYRVHDWGRNRELHIQKAIEAFRKINPDDLVVRSLDNFACSYFEIYRCYDDTYIRPNSIVVMLTDGLINDMRANQYGTYLLLGKQFFHLKGDALVIKLADGWYQLQKAIAGQASDS